MPMIFWHTWLSVNEELGCVWMTMNPAERRTVASGGYSMHINKNGVQDEPVASREAAVSLLLNLHWRGSNWAVTGWVQCATIVITLCANMAGFQGESRKTYVLSEVFWNQIHLFMFWKKKFMDTDLGIILLRFTNLSMSQTGKVPNLTTGKQRTHCQILIIFSLEYSGLFLVC